MSLKKGTGMGIMSTEEAREKDHTKESGGAKTGTGERNGIIQSATIMCWQTKCSRTQADG